MRAGRLLTLLVTLQAGGRWRAADLAERLGVSERTVLRDLEVLSGAGVPVYGVRGPGGGFELLDTYDRASPEVPPGMTSSPGRLRRVRVRIAPSALQRALLEGRPDGWRPRPEATTTPDPQRPSWVEGSFRFTSDAAAITELAALAPDVEVLLPLHLREAMADLGTEVTALHTRPGDHVR